MADWRCTRRNRWGSTPIESKTFHSLAPFYPSSRPMNSSAQPAFNARDIRGHIERHVGSITQVFPGADGIEIVDAGPSERRPWHTLITCGMSAHRMSVPESEHDAPRYLELMMTLPEDWKLDAGSLAEATWNWPITELTRLAGLPRVGDRWLGWGHAIPHGTPPAPYSADTKLCGVILAPSLLVKESFYELHLDQHRVAFFSAIPLYREELDLRGQRGMEVLLSKLIDNEINDVVQLRRRNVAKKRFGWF